MQATFLGFLNSETGERKPCYGFTVGKAYNVEPHMGDSGTVFVRDDHGAARSRPATDFAPATLLRRAWARFPSLQRVFS